MSLARKYSKLTAAAIVFILQILIPTVLSQVVTSNVTNQNVCPGDVITFNCSTTGSGGIAWSSDEYIGIGNELEFNVDDVVGDTRTSRVNPNVVATFLHNNGSGNPLLRSQLTLTVSSTFLSPSVSCVYVSNRSRVHTVQLQTLADPEMPSEMISDQIMMDSMNCILHLLWRPPANIESSDLSCYVLHVNGEIVATTTHTVTSTSSLQRFAYALCPCGNHTVTSIHAVNRCERAGSETESVNVTVVMNATKYIPMCDAQTTTAANVTKSSEQGCRSDLKGIIAFLCVVLVVLVGE